MQLLFIASQQYKLNMYFQDFMPILLFICIYMGYIGETGGDYYNAGGGGVYESATSDVYYPMIWQAAQPQNVKKKSDQLDKKRVAYGIYVINPRICTDEGEATTDSAI